MGGCEKGAFPGQRDLTVRQMHLRPLDEGELRFDVVKTDVT